MINIIIQALCVGVMCAVCYKMGIKKGMDEMVYILSVISKERSEQNDD